MAHNPIHTTADAIEPRLARAYVLSTERLQESISINELALTLSMRNTKAAIKIASREVEKVLLPLGAIVKDTVIRGGKIGAKIVGAKIVVLIK